MVRDLLSSQLRRALLCLVLLAVILATFTAIATAGGGLEQCTFCVCKHVEVTQLCCVASPMAQAEEQQLSGTAEQISACFSDPGSAQCARVCSPSPPPGPCKAPPCDAGERIEARTRQVVVGVAVTKTGPDACDGCPPSEDGQCGDGVDNDQWIEMSGATDCVDTDCAGDTACPAEMAPATSNAGLAIVAACLLAVGLLTAGRRRSDRRSSS